MNDLQYFHTVHIGQANIQIYQVKRLLRKKIQPFLATGCGCDIEAGPFKDSGQCLTQRRLVIDEQDITR
jgi:hypothetical protein